MSRNKRQAGFTLVELITVLAVVGVLVVFAAPGVQRLLQSNQMTAQTNRLVSGLHLARSEAVKRNAEVEVCGSSDGEACSGEWAAGWIVRLKTSPEAGDRVLHSGGFEVGTSLETNVEEITYQGDGIAQVSGEGPEAKIILVNASFRREVKVYSGGSVRSCTGECKE